MKWLRDLLKGIRPGRIEDSGDLEKALAACWDDLGGDVGGMKPEKLHNRMEEVEWNPPILTFQIERHGGAVMGSSRAEMQHWEVDIDRQVCLLNYVGRRQLRPMQPRLNVTPLTEEIARLIEAREQDDRLKWYDDGRVRVLIGEILPETSAVKETLANRRKRFWAALDDCLRLGWERRQQTYLQRGGSDRT